MDGRLERVARRFTDVAERYVPDAFVFALLATLIVFVAAVGVGAGPGELTRAWGDGFWELLAFTMQMVLIIITGYVVASASAVHRLIGFVASRATGSPRTAVVTVAIFSMVASWFNWGFALIFSAVLAREIARRSRGVDYRALCAAAMTGLGSVWAQGLSGSAALQMATPGALSPKIREIVAAGGVVPNGIIGFHDTIFLWQSLVAVAIEIVVVSLVMWFATPTGDRARDAQALGVELSAAENVELRPPATPGERLEHSPILMLLVVAVGVFYLVQVFSSGKGVSALTLNTINLGLLLVGAFLHRTPARLMRAVKEATPATWGVILQFPFYAGIAAMIASTKLNERLAHLFVSLSTRETFPALMAAYSTLLGVFVPSGGGKWIIEAPYVMKAAHDLKVHLGWVVACYDLGEALANLVQPFFMLPVVGILGIRTRDVMGFTLLVFLVLTPLVLLLAVLLGMTLHYPL